MNELQLFSELKNIVQNYQILQGLKNIVNNYRFIEEDHPRDERGRFTEKGNINVYTDSDITYQHFSPPFEDIIIPVVNPKAYPDRLEPLTKRELETLYMAAAGLTNEEIAKRIYVSKATTKVNIASILKKFKVNNRTLASVLAVKYGLIDADIAEKFELPYKSYDDI